MECVGVMLMEKKIECGFAIVLTNYFFIDFVAVIGTGDFRAVEDELSSHGEVIDSHLFLKEKEVTRRIYDILVEYFSLPPWVRKDETSLWNMINALNFVREETREVIEVILRFLGSW